ETRRNDNSQYPSQPFDNPDQVQIPPIDTKDEGEIFDSPVDLTITVKQDPSNIHLYFPSDGVARTRPVIRNLTFPSYTTTNVRQDVSEIKKFFFRSNDSLVTTVGTYWQYRVGNRWVYIGPGESWRSGDYTKPSIKNGARGLPLHRRLTGDEWRPINKLSVANPYSGVACCSTYFFNCSTVAPPQLATK
ncbi:hypothetical protein, partial [Floridanema aerugineum]